MAKERIGQIEALMSQISKTEDPKAIAELQARIAIEQAAMQNEDTKLRMLQMVAEAESRILRQQQQEAIAEERSRTKGIELTPINWDE
jgi:type IV secretion system protein VirB5